MTAWRDRFDPHRPAIRPAPSAPSSLVGVEIDAPLEHRVDAHDRTRRAHRSPSMPVRGRNRSRDRRAATSRSMPRRLLRSDSAVDRPRRRAVFAGADCRAAGAITASITERGGDGRDRRPPLRHRSAALRQRCRSCAPRVGSGLALDRGALEPRRVPALARRRTRRPSASSRRRPARRAWRTPPAARSGRRRSRPDRSRSAPNPTPNFAVSSAAQHRLIQATEGALVLLQHPRIQRHPPPIGGLDLRRDHQMRVELRVIQPRRRLPERRHDQPLGVQMQPATVRADTGRRSRTAPTHRPPPRPRRHDTRADRSSPVSAHSTDNDFGADTVASNPATALTTRPSLVVRSVNARPEASARSRDRGRRAAPATARRRPLPDQAQAGGLSARSTPRELTRRLRQVLRVVRSRRRGRRRIQRGHTHHDGHHRPKRAPVCQTNSASNREEGGERSREGRRSVLAAQLQVRIRISCIRPSVRHVAVTR